MTAKAATQPEDDDVLSQTAAAKPEGLGISSSATDTSLFSPEEFAQTKDSSDDLVDAASVNGTPSPKRVGDGDVDKHGEGDSPHRIPKYKIALASHLLSPSKTPVS